MKKGLHPELHTAKVHCACGEQFETISTKDDIRTTICQKCHPFFTGAQKFVDTAGRIERFEQRYKKFKAEPQTAKTETKKAGSKRK